MARNVPMKDPDKIMRLCVHGTDGFNFHHVQPAKNEREIFKIHPSIFHKDSITHTTGSKNITFKQGRGVLHTTPMHPHDYLQKLDIKTLAFTGVLSSRCVNGSIIGASIYGYNCLEISNLIGEPRGQAFKSEAAEHAKTRSMLYSHSINSKQFIAALTT